MAKKRNRVVSVPDDENKNMIIVSQIQKNDRVRKKVCVGASFSAHSSRTLNLHSEKNIEIMDKYRLIEKILKTRGY